jgi:hypothetical protein
MLTVPTHVQARVDRLLASVTEAEARLIAGRIHADATRLEAGR